MKEGKRLRRWEGEIKPGQRTEDRVLNAECGMRKEKKRSEDG